MYTNFLFATTLMPTPRTLCLIATEQPFVRQVCVLVFCNAPVFFTICHTNTCTDYSREQLASHVHTDPRWPEKEVQATYVPPKVTVTAGT